MNPLQNQTLSNQYIYQYLSTVYGAVMKFEQA